MILESNSEKTGQKDRPRSLHFQVSRASITNVRSVERCSRADLAKCIHSYELGTLFYGEDFPSQPGDYHIVTDKFVNHVECKYSYGLFVNQKYFIHTYILCNSKNQFSCHI